MEPVKPSISNPSRHSHVVLFNLPWIFSPKYKSSILYTYVYNFMFHIFDKEFLHRCV